MAYSTLRAAIQQAIKQNDNEEITGNLLQSVLLSIVNTVGAGYNFAGVATPSTNPGTPDGAMFWIGGKGTYANFGSSVTIAVGYLGIFMWDGSAFTRSVLKLSGGEGVFDVTDYTGNEYANLSAALAAIPQEAKAGGMEIRYVQNTDHKYVQYRLMATSFSLNVTDWKCVDVNIADLYNIIGIESVFKEETTTNNRGVSSDGAIQVVSDLYVSTFIPLKNAKYVAVVDNLGSDYYGHAFYDSLKNYIPNSFVRSKGSGLIGPLVMEVPQSAEYVVITGNTQRKNNQKVFLSLDYYELTELIEKVSSVGFTMINETVTVPSTNIFTSLDISLNKEIYYNFDVNDGKSCILGFYDSNDNRILYCGKLSAYSGETHYEGKVKIPNNFAYAKFIGNSQNIFVSFLVTESNNMILANNDIENTIIGTVMPNLFVSYDSQNRAGFYSMQNSKCATCDVSRLVGEKIFISAKQLTTTYSLIYCFFDKNNYLVSEYKGSSAYEEVLESKVVTVPENAVFLYVNCALAENLEVSTKSVKEIVNSYPEFHLKEKKIVTYGDSLTWYDTHAFTWGEKQGDMCAGFQTYLRNFLKMVTTNRGYSGYTTPQICNTIRTANDLNAFDYMTIMGGDNDHRLNVNIGTLQPIGGTFDTSTIYGALQSAIEYALSQNPELRIILMTEPIGWTYKNGSYERVSDAIPDSYRKVAELYGLPLVDNWYNSGINELTRNTYYCDPADNELYYYHPNNSGWERISRYIVNEIKDK